MDDAELYFLPKQFPPGWMAHSAYMPECVRIRLVIGQGTPDDVSGHKDRRGERTATSPMDPSA